MLLENCAMEPFPAFFEGPALTLTTPDETASSALGAFLQRYNRMPRWETVLGLALSLGLHASFLLTVMLCAQTLPQPAPEPHFVLVSLEEVGTGGAGGAEEGKGGLRDQGAGQDLSSSKSSAPARETEPPAVPEPAMHTAQPPLSEERLPEPPEPVVTKWTPPGKPTGIAGNSKPITRQPVRKVEPKPEKQKEASPAAAETPHAEPQASPGNHAGKDAGQMPAGTPAAAAADGAGLGTGQGGGTTGGKGGSHHGPGTGAAEFTVKQVDRPPVVLRKVEPTFPEAARKMGLTGKVVAKLLVGADGRVSRISIREAAPHGIFEQDVLKALKQWEFKPGYYKDQAVATWVVVPVNFRLSP